jgi:hypothetical protein
MIDVDVATVGDGLNIRQKPLIGGVHKISCWGIGATVSEDWDNCLPAIRKICGLGKSSCNIGTR